MAADRMWGSLAEGGRLPGGRPRTAALWLAAAATAAAVAESPAPAVVVTLAATPATASGPVVSGRVATPEGVAASRARVVLLPQVTDYERARLALAGRALPAPVARARVAADGGYLLAAPGVGFYRLVVRAEGLVPMEHLLTPLVEDLELGVVELVADEPIEVTLVGPDGAPAAGGWVRASSARRELWLTGWRRVGWRPLPRLGRTDAAGKVRLWRRAGEPLDVRGWAPALVESEEERVSAGQATLRLARAEPRPALVADPAGRPLAGVVAMLGEEGWPAGVTGDDGRLTLDLPADGAAPPGPSVRLDAADGRRATVSFAAAAGEIGEPERLSLPAIGAFHGRVLDGGRRRPLAGAVVYLRGEPARWVLSDAAGGFTLPRPPAFTLVEAAAPGHLGGIAQAAVGDDGPLTLILEPAWNTGGVTVDEAGTPVAGVEIEAEPRPEQGRQIRHFYRDPPRHARSDQRGAFRIGGLRPALAYRLVATRAGFAPAAATVTEPAPAAAPSPVRLVLRPGATASGRVVDEAGEPVAGAELILKESPPADVQVHFLYADLDLGDEFATASDAGGGFSWRHLPAGSFDLTAKAAGYAAETVRGFEIGDAGAVDLGAVVLRAGVALEGRVVDPDGAPLPGAEIRMYPSEAGVLTTRYGQGGAADAVSEADGGFRLPDRRRGELLDLEVSLAGYAEAELPRVEVDDLEPLVVTLEPASTISGRVLDPGREPIQQAQVMLFGEGGGTTAGGFFNPGRRLGATVSDARGAFALEGVRPGSLRLMVSAQGFVPLELGGLEARPGSALEDLELVLERGATVVGTVRDAEGTPVDGAWVRVGEGGRMASFGGSSATTDGEGRFRLGGVEPGLRVIVARTDDQRQTAGELEVAPGENRLDLRFRPGHEVAGRVVDPAGAPVAEAVVSLSNSGPLSWGGLQARSGAGGEFRFEAVESGSYTLRAQHPEFATAALPAPVEVGAAPVLGLEVRLETGGAVAGSLVGLPPESLAAVEVMAVRPSRMIQGVVRPDGSYRVSGLAPGEWQLYATTAGGRSTSAQATVEPGAGETRVDLEFGSGLLLTGQVLRGGEPFVNARVAATGKDVAAAGWGQTDHRGRFRIEGLEAGAYLLMIQEFRSGFLHREELELRSDRDLLIEVETHRLAGQVLDATDGQPVDGAVVALVPAETVEGAAFFGFGPGATTDANGRFGVDHVPAGSYRLRTTRDGYALLETEVRVAELADPQGLEVLLTPTEGVRLEVTLPSGAPATDLVAVVLDAAGRPVAGGAYQPAAGRVRFATLPPGEWWILLRSSGTAVESLRVTAPGGLVPVRLERGARLEISLPGLEDDAGLVTVEVRADDGTRFQDPGWGGQVQSQWRLGFGRTVEHLPAGAWTVHASTTDGRSWQRRLTVAAGATHQVVLE